MWTVPASIENHPKGKEEEVKFKGRVTTIHMPVEIETNSELVGIEYVIKRSPLSSEW